MGQDEVTVTSKAREAGRRERGFVRKIQYDCAEWKPAFLRQAREFLLFPLPPSEASKRVSIFDRETRLKLEGSDLAAWSRAWALDDSDVILTLSARVSAQAPWF